jgi:hypothetical protein
MSEFCHDSPSSCIGFWTAPHVVSFFSFSSHYFMWGNCQYCLPSACSEAFKPVTEMFWGRRYEFVLFDAVEEDWAHSHSAVFFGLNVQVKFLARKAALDELHTHSTNLNCSTWYDVLKILQLEFCGAFRVLSASVFMEFIVVFKLWQLTASRSRLLSGTYQQSLHWLLVSFRQRRAYDILFTCY